MVIKAQKGQFPWQKHWNRRGGGGTECICSVACLVWSDWTPDLKKHFTTWATDINVEKWTNFLGNQTYNFHLEREKKKEKDFHRLTIKERHKLNLNTRILNGCLNLFTLHAFYQLDSQLITKRTTVNTLQQSGSNPASEGPLSCWF